MNNMITRPNYFSGEALLTDDFKSEQAFHLSLLRYNNASLRTHGIARGLEVYWEEDSNQVKIDPGMAIDRLGREIILTQERIIKLDNIGGLDPWFLTINYHEVYADLTEEPGSGIKGYKRIVQEPQVDIVQIPKESGLNILLAVISFNANDKVNKISYRSGNFQRKYVGSILGEVRFITEGTGVNEGELDKQRPVLSLFEENPADNQFSSIVAKKETTNDDSYLEVNAARTQFMSTTTSRGNLGIGIDQPFANLQIDAITFKGKGSLSSIDQQVTLTGKMSPFLAVNDLIISDPQVNSGPKQTRKLIKIISHDNASGISVFTIDKAFNPPLNNASFTYIRSRLAAFSSPSNGNLLEVNIDGSIGLGNRSLNHAGADNKGHNALYISVDRKVGIGLTAGEPQVELEVKGEIKADALTVAGNVISEGVVKAKSFEGNGELLKNLPILSYWTKETVGDQASKLHYVEGNVGIQMTNPPGSLSVGGGTSIVGKGFVSTGPKRTPGSTGADIKADNTLVGNQTQFTKEVSIGDTITIGNIIPQPVKITEIVSKTELKTVLQVPFVVSDSKYKLLDQGEGEPKTGEGTISSNGTSIIGNGTDFTQFKAGDDIIVDRFDWGSSDVQTWYVKSVSSDSELTLIPRHTGADKNFVARDSAYMVTSALLTHIQSSAEYSVLNTTHSATDENDATASLPPALLVAANGLQKGMAENTVAINVELDDLKSQYALQVNGDVSFAGQSHFKDLSVETLSVSKSLTVSADNTEDNILVVGESGETPLLNVSKTNVQIGQQINPSQYPLDVSGDIYASDTISAGNNITASNDITATKNLNATALLARAMTVAGTSIYSDNSVSIIADRTTSGSLSNNGERFQQKAPTDGFVVVSVGIAGLGKPSIGAIVGKTSTTVNENSSLTSTALASSSFGEYTVSVGKKGSKTYIINYPGSFTLPVKKGEYWTVEFLSVPDLKQFPAPQNQYQFVPLGPDQGAQAVSASDVLNTTSVNAKAAVRTEPYKSYIPDMVKKFHTDASAIIPPASDETPQEVIDRRMSDLTSILSKSTPMNKDEDSRNKFINELSKIVCTVDNETGKLHNQFAQKDMDKLISTYSDITGKTFTADETSLLRSGINALVQINANEKNRHDLVLIKANIDTFIDALATAMHMTFSREQRRLLTRALVRLVGDGTQSPSDITADVKTDSTSSSSHSSNSPHHSTIKSFIASLESDHKQSFTEDIKDEIKKHIEDVITKSKDHQQGTDNIVKSVEKATGSSLKKDAKAVLISATKKLFGSLL